MSVARGVRTKTDPTPTLGCNRRSKFWTCRLPRTRSDRVSPCARLPLTATADLRTTAYLTQQTLKAPSEDDLFEEEDLFEDDGSDEDLLEDDEPAAPVLDRIGTARWWRGKGDTYRTGFARPLMSIAQALQWSMTIDYATLETPDDRWTVGRRADRQVPRPPAEFALQGVPYEECALVGYVVSLWLAKSEESEFALALANYEVHQPDPECEIDRVASIRPDVAEFEARLMAPNEHVALETGANWLRHFVSGVDGLPDHEGQGRLAVGAAGVRPALQ